MYKKIKSHFLLSKIFGLLNFIRKLNLISYNKRLQNNFDIKILDYRRISGKYIVGEINGIGKEYKIVADGINKLLYDGELLNGKRNGKGKEFNNNGKLIFEGTFENGKRWNGKGKEYNKEGELIFEGEYKEGKRWNGKGKEYNNEGELMFEGEYKEGNRWNGKGKRYFNKYAILVKNRNKNAIENKVGKDYKENEYIYKNGKVTKNKNCIIY